MNFSGRHQDVLTLVRQMNADIGISLTKKKLPTFLLNFLIIIPDKFSLVSHTQQTLLTDLASFYPNLKFS
jgi:hypothetical protein